MLEGEERWPRLFKTGLRMDEDAESGDEAAKGIDDLCRTHLTCPYCDAVAHRPAAAERLDPRAGDPLVGAEDEGPGHGTRRGQQGDPATCTDNPAEGRQDHRPRGPAAADDRAEVREDQVPGGVSRQWQGVSTGRQALPSPL